MLLCKSYLWMALENAVNVIIKFFHGITFNEKVKELVELSSMVKAECNASSYICHELNLAEKI